MTEPRSFRPQFTQGRGKPSPVRPRLIPQEQAEAMARGTLENGGYVFEPEQPVVQTPAPEEPSRDTTGLTPLFEAAARKRNRNIVEFLIKHRADVNRRELLKENLKKETYTFEKISKIRDSFNDDRTYKLLQEHPILPKGPRRL